MCDKLPGVCEGASAIAQYEAALACDGQGNILITVESFSRHAMQMGRWRVTAAIAMTTRPAVSFAWLQYASDLFPELAAEAVSIL